MKNHVRVANQPIAEMVLPDRLEVPIRSLQMPPTWTLPYITTVGDRP